MVGLPITPSALADMMPAALNPDPDTSFVYVLGSADAARRLTYVGWTNDLDRRLRRHNAGTGARSTRGRFWVLLHSEQFETRREAQSREWHLKRDRAFRRALSQTILRP